MVACYTGAQMLRRLIGQIMHQSHVSPACRASHPPAGDQTILGSRRPKKCET